MGRLYQFHFELYSDSTFTNLLLDLGVHTVGVGTYSGDISKNEQEITNDFNFFTDETDTVILGSPSFSYNDTYSEALNGLKSYIPLINILNVPHETTYTNGYIKFTDTTSGFYGKSRNTMASSATSFQAYDNNDNFIGNVYFSAPYGFWTSNYFFGDMARRARVGCMYFPENITVGSHIFYGAAYYPDKINRVYGRILDGYTVEQAFVTFINGLTPYVEDTDPFAPGGESDTGGGTGNFDGTSVDIDFASLPTLSAVDTGFITLYNPTLAQLQSLANYMWSGIFDIDTFKKLFADPMQAILGLSIVPGPVPGGTTQNVKIGNIDSGVTMTKAATQYINIDCGTLNVEEFWGAYLDYEPYTKAEIYLPFIGVHQIAVDDIMNKPVHIMYHIDLLSGGCACEIKCGGSVLYTFIGSCAVSIPVTGSDWTNLLNGVLSAASAMGNMVATGGASAPAAATTIASAAINSLKPSIEKSGSVAGAGGLLAGKVPVLILTRPRQALPGGQNTYTGYPAFVTRSLGDLTGYTEVHSIRLSGIDGTESEIDEIEELLKGGVIL